MLLQLLWLMTYMGVGARCVVCIYSHMSQVRFNCPQIWVHLSLKETTFLRPWKQGHGNYGNIRKHFVFLWSPRPGNPLYSLHVPWTSWTSGLRPHSIREEVIPFRSCNYCRSAGHKHWIRWRISPSLNQQLPLLPFIHTAAVTWASPHHGNKGAIVAAILHRRD